MGKQIARRIQQYGLFSITGKQGSYFSFPPPCRVPYITSNCKILILHAGTDVVTWHKTTRCEPRTSHMWRRSVSHHTITFALAPTSALCLLKSFFHDPQMWKSPNKSSGLKGQTECSQSHKYGRRTVKTQLYLL